MAATKRFTDIPISVNSTPEMRQLIKDVATWDNCSENSVVRWLLDNPVTLPDLAGKTKFGIDIEEGTGDEVRKYHVPRGY